MTVEQSQVISLLKEIHLFHGMEEARLQRVASFFTEKPFSPDQIIIKEDSEGDFFFIVYDGEVVISQQVNEVDQQLGILVPGDFFGEASLLQGTSSTETVTAATYGILLTADCQNFKELLDEYPEVRTHLWRGIRSRSFIRTHPFPWLNEDELVYHLSRKHIAHLIITLLLPSLVFLIGAAIALYLMVEMSHSSLQPGLIVFASLVMFAGIAWGIWAVIDWANDYYIVTNQRVVWIEKVIFLYESRMEAPLATIQAVNVHTELLGRFLGYGDITVNTYTGKILLRIIADPYQISALIQEYWHRAQVSFVHEEKEETVRSVNRMLGMEEPPAEPEHKAAPKPFKGDDFEEPGFIATYLSNIFTLRYEEGRTITYRKHWLVLIKKTWKPLVAFGVLFFAMLLCVATSATGQIGIMEVEVFIGLGIFIILFFIFPWWLYNYADWRNDIYQLTDKNIFDIERKPLGTEVRKSGSLENILSLEHTRPGFLGYVFNVGNVIINFGDAKFDFIGVYEPARVQQDIFNRMHLLRIQQQKDEMDRERERVLSILNVYHNNVRGTQNENQMGWY
jgi:hypothetical protein